MGLLPIELFTWTADQAERTVNFGHFVTVNILTALGRYYISYISETVRSCLLSLMKKKALETVWNRNWNWNFVE